MSLISRKIDQIKRIFLNKIEIDFIKKNKNINKKIKNKKIIIIEMGEDIYFLIHFYFLLKEKIFKNKTIIGLWINHGNIKKPGFKNFLSFVFNFILLHLIKLKWKKIYKCLGVDYVIDLNNYLKENLFIKNTTFLKKNLNLISKESFLKTKYNGIHVGDLIYDHYIRFTGEQTLNIKNTYAIKRILTSIENAYKNLNIFYKKNKTKIDYYIAQKGFYLNGFAVRFFLHKKIKTVGGFDHNTYIKKFSKNNYLSGANCKNLSRQFYTIKFKKKKIDLAKKRLNQKFKGKINLEYKYMRKNPYLNVNTYKVKKKLIV